MDLTQLGGRYGGCFVEDDDGGVHGLHTSVRDALLELGVIWRERDGTWRIKNENRRIIEDKRPDLACCDFCTGRPVVWDVACADFELEGQISIGGWAACEPCGQAVVDGDHPALLRRVLHANRHFHENAWLYPWLDLFWQHYNGIARLPKPLHFGH